MHAPTPQQTQREQKSRTKSRKSFWLRQFYTIHWMSSAMSLIGLLLFAITGFTLNHAAEIVGAPVISEASAQLPEKLLPLVAPDGRPDGKKPLPPEVAGERIAQQGRVLDKFEQERADFHGRVRQAYLERAAEAPRRIRVINAGQSLANIKKQVEQIVLTDCL